jgi:hypothetical protein
VTKYKPDRPGLKKTGIYPTSIAREKNLNSKDTSPFKNELYKTIPIFRVTPSIPKNVNG